MGSLFSKPKEPPAPPPVKPAPPVPQVQEDVGDVEMKRVAGRSGYQKTILTGAVEPNTGKKRLLG